MNLKSNFSLITEIYYFYIFLFNFFFILSLNNIYIFTFIKKYLYINLNFILFKKINKSLNSNISYHILNFKEVKFNNTPFFKNINYLKKNNLTIFKFINLFFLFNFSLFNNNFKVNHNFNLFFVYSFSNKVIILDPIKFTLRWKDSYDLLFNIYFYNFNPLIFSTSLFKNETISLNWNYNHFDINVWKYYFPFFIFKLINYNNKTSFFFDKLYLNNINFFLITDCYYHFKNLYYINKKNLYSIGIVNVNLNPWIVSYPLLSFFENFLTNIFFFKILIFIERKALLSKYLFFKNLWFRNYLIKKILK